jgi:flagellar biosynthetic protein FliP
LTSFTRIAVVLSLTRNALGLQGVPPNQVIVGLSLFLSLFVMGPTIQEMNDTALQPYLDGRISQGEAYEQATGPIREFMLENTRTAELDLMMDATPGGRPETIEAVGITTIIPAFVLSELKTAFLMGFVIFIPFLIIDLVVASVLMSLGMMMLPPVFVSLPFKLLLFVLVGGWSLIVETLLASYM